MPKDVIKRSKQKEASSSSYVKNVMEKNVTKAIVVHTKKAEKKTFTLPGQKHDPPEERDPLRIFYETLHQQIPDSEMAEIWMMEHGLLEEDHAKQVLERKQRRAQSERNGTPIKSSGPPKSERNGTPIKSSGPPKTERNGTSIKSLGPPKIEKNGIPMKSSAPLKNVNSTAVKTSTTSRDSNNRLGSKGPSQNGRNNQVVESKGKRKREYSSDDDDDEFIAIPVKRKLLKS